MNINIQELLLQKLEVDDVDGRVLGEAETVSERASYRRSLIFKLLKYFLSTRTHGRVRGKMGASVVFVGLGSQGVKARFPTSTSTKHLWVRSTYSSYRQVLARGCDRREPSTTGMASPSAADLQQDAHSDKSCVGMLHRFPSC